MSIRSILFSWLRQDGLPSKEDLKNDAPIQGSIYPGSGTISKSCSRFYWVHAMLKSKLFVPFLFVFKMFVGNRLIDVPEDKFYNRNLKMLDRSWRDSMTIMGSLYNPCFNNPNSSSYQEYDLVRKTWLTLATYDTATREFTNVFCHTLAQNMRQEYKNHKHVYHVFYDSHRIYDATYFRISQLLFDDMFNMDLWKDKQRQEIIDGIKKELTIEAKTALANEYAQVNWLELGPGLKKRLQLAWLLLSKHKEPVRLAVSIHHSQQVSGTGDRPAVQDNPS
jgi:hypothetical protein